jgi:Protein of unknown function (DUF1573)
MRRLLPIVVALSAVASLRAGLEMEKEPIELLPKPEDEVVETTFSFTNKSDKPIRVTGLESACSCLEASLDKAVYQPGEKGKGRATFKVSSFVGRHEKTLHIYTDDAAEPDKVVNFVIDIPAIVETEPNLVEWIVGDKLEPKEMTIKMTGPEPIKITEIKTTREMVSAELKEIKPGREYRIILTPKATDTVLVGAVLMQTDSKIPKYQRQTAFFNIVRPEQAEKKKKAEAENK